MSGTDVRRTDTGSLLCCLMTMLVEVLSHSDPRRVRSNLLYCHDDPLGDAWGWLHRSFHSHWTIKQLRPLEESCVWLLRPRSSLPFTPAGTCFSSFGYSLKLCLGFMGKMCKRLCSFALSTGTSRLVIFADSLDAERETGENLAVGNTSKGSSHVDNDGVDRPVMILVHNGHCWNIDIMQRFVHLREFSFSVCRGCRIPSFAQATPGSCRRRSRFHGCGVVVSTQQAPVVAYTTRTQVASRQRVRLGVVNDVANILHCGNRKS